MSSLVDKAAVERLLLLTGAMRSGIVDALSGPGARTAEEVASSAGADLRACRVILDALAEEGVVNRDGGTYLLTTLGRSHLLDPGPEFERYRLLHLANRARGWLELPEVIRNGRPLPRDPARSDLQGFVMAMSERSPEAIGELVERCMRFAGSVRTMLDVGGAVGHIARAFTERGVGATLLDREDVIALAEEFLGPDAARIALVAGDFTESLPEGPFDLVYLGNICHIYSPSTNAVILAEVFGALAPGGTIAIHDHVLGRSLRGAMFAVNMLQATEEGGVWSEPEYRAWLKAAGFSGVEVFDLSESETQLVLGRKPTGDYDATC